MHRRRHVERPRRARPGSSSGSASSLLITFLLSYTTFGRRVYAIGNNPQASFLAGINVRLVTVVLYMLSGLFAALAGITLAAYGGQASLGMGDPVPLPVDRRGRDRRRLDPRRARPLPRHGRRLDHARRARQPAARREHAGLGARHRLRRARSSASCSSTGARRARPERASFVRLSYEIRFEHPGWPGNPTYSYEQISSIERGDIANFGMLHLLGHFGSHVDGPNHFNPDGIKVAQVPLDRFVYERPVLLDVPKVDRELVLRDGARAARGGDRRGRPSCSCAPAGPTIRKPDPVRYAHEGPGVSPEACTYLIDGFPALKALALDCISLAAYRRIDPEGILAHQILCGVGRGDRYVLIVEDLDLAAYPPDAAPGVYAIPLFPRGDGLEPLHRLRRARRMKVTGLETILVGEFPNLCYVRVHTDDGISGLGETFFGAEAVSAWVHETAAAYLLGKDPLRIDAHWQALNPFVGFNATGGREPRPLGGRHRALGPARQGLRPADPPAARRRLARPDPHLQHVRRLPLRPPRAGDGRAAGLELERRAGRGRAVRGPRLVPDRRGVARARACSSRASPA